MNRSNAHSLNRSKTHCLQGRGAHGEEEPVDVVGDKGRHRGQEEDLPLFVLAEDADGQRDDEKRKRQNGEDVKKQAVVAFEGRKQHKYNI